MFGELLMYSEIEQAVFDSWILDSLALPLGRNKLPNQKARKEFYYASDIRGRLGKRPRGELGAPAQTELINAYFVNTFSLKSPEGNTPELRNTHFLVRELFELAENSIEEEERGVLISLFYSAPALNSLKGDKSGEEILRFILYSGGKAALGVVNQKSPWLPDRYLNEPFSLKAEASPFERMVKWFEDNWEACIMCANALIFVSQEYQKKRTDFENSEDPARAAEEFVVKTITSYLKLKNPKAWIDEADILMELY